MVVKFIVITFILLIIFSFIPIPIKIKFIYEDKIAKLFIYGFNINLRSLMQKKKNYSNVKKQKNKFNIENAKTILKKIDSSNFKPKLNLKITIDYGFSDASITGLSYGLINMMFPIVYRLFKVIFKFKNFDYHINPDFNNVKVKLQVNSIIYISLVNVMYMVFTIYITLKKTLKKQM